MERERFKKMFPRLAEEMECGSSRISMDNLGDTLTKKNPNISRKWSGYNPDVVDFIRRCGTTEQAEEVIGYMEGRGEVTTDRATELRQQLWEKGLRSFGSRKEEDYYHRDR